MGERRSSVRQKSFLRGCVYFNKRRNSLDCLIRDISSEGARIIFSDTVNVPDLIELYIPQKEQTVRARVQWRHGDEIGLAFPDALRAADGTSQGELAMRVAHLETEIASLRRVLKRLKVESSDDVDAA
ncbi:MAG TPA: PilZ domain-containing protein [Xanthobacteraceae bacterium]|nr:PilZ domain-containing protein [Xanthobacteraceae bacterium]